MKEVTLYSDGACSGNPGPGGFGTILECNGATRELSRGYAHTTNNRMELLGIIEGLTALKEPCRVTVVTDSQYVVNAMTKGWARRWKENNWRRNRKERALNPDLWDRLLSLCTTHRVTFTWIRGHNGHTQNERCDQLAVAASRGSGLGSDVPHGE